MSESSKAVFIQQIAAYIMEMAPAYNIKVVSPIIAQACKESAFGTSELAVKARNYFGLKYKTNRCPGASSIPYEKVGSEQNADGSYTSSPMKWFSFATMEDGVKGYFDFINISNYSNLKNIADPETYCNRLKQDGYATSATYASSLMDYISKYNLTQYDSKEVIENMSYTNSSLVSYTQLSPCRTANRTHDIDSIVIHCYVGQVSVERMGKGWANLSANASANYGIGTDGRIGLYVEEKDRAWTTGGKWAVNGITGSVYDQRAVTIECACDTAAPYSINDKVYASLVNLCADICKRNNIKKLLWKGDKSLVGKVDQQNMVVHRWFAAKSCPGDYIYNRLGQIANEVNEKLGVVIPASTDSIIYYTVVKGDTLAKIANAYGTTVSSIALSNGIKNANKISVGQVLKILADADEIPTTYTVVKGDSLAKIANKTGVALTTLKKLNPTVKAPLYIIHAGQVLKLK